MKTIKFILKGLAAIILLFAVVKTFQYIFFDPIVTTFNINVATERIDYEVVDENTSRLVLAAAEIANYDEILIDTFYGSLELNKKTTVRIERIGMGPIGITLENKSPAGIGTLYNGDSGEKILVAEEFMEIFIYDIEQKVNDGVTYVFSIDGKVELGRSVNLEIFDESTALLRGGIIKMVGSSTFGSKHFEAGTEELMLGDHLVFDETQSKAFGFVTINENPGMSAVYRVVAKEGIVYKPGPRSQDSGTIISASLLNWVLKDRLFQGLSFTFALIVSIMTLLSFYMDFKLYVRETQKK